MNRILNARFVQRLLSRFLLPTLAHSRAYWQNSLQPRERAALSSLGAILTVALFYLIIWNPLNSFVAESRLDRDQQLALLQYMRSTEQDVRLIANNGIRATATGQSMLTEVSTSAQAAGINPSRMQPEGDQAISVWFDVVAFSPLAQWLEQLASTKGIIVRQITMNQVDEPGLVSVRLVLRTR